MSDNPQILTVKGVTKRFRISGENSLFPRTFEAVKNVSFDVPRGETFGIVGESGCGKSTIAKLIMCIEQPTSGEIWFDGRRIDDLPERTRRSIRPKFQMVFQDSGASLNPRKTISRQLLEPMRQHRIGRADKRVQELLDMVGLPSGMAMRYPHELSGGQRQRVCIARALSLNPELVVLDEPVSALDVSVQAQILNLLRDLQSELHLTCVFIGHGLGAVHYISHHIAVMYMGRVLETAPSEELFTRPAHPYTRALIDAAPSANPLLRDRSRLSLAGEIGERVPDGACDLYPRCPYAAQDCFHFSGALKPVPGQPMHTAACCKALNIS